MKIKFEVVLEVENESKFLEWLQTRMSPQELAMLFYPMKWWMDAGKMSVLSANILHEKASEKSEV